MSFLSLSKMAMVGSGALLGRFATTIKKDFSLTRMTPEDAKIKELLSKGLHFAGGYLFRESEDRIEGKISFKYYCRVGDHFVDPALVSVVVGWNKEGILTDVTTTDAGHVELLPLTPKEKKEVENYCISTLQKMKNMSRFARELLGWQPVSEKIVQSRSAVPPLLMDVEMFSAIDRLLREKESKL